MPASKVRYELRYVYHEFGVGAKKGRLQFDDLGAAHSTRAKMREMVGRDGKGGAWLERTYDVHGFILSIIGLFEITETKIE